MNDFLSFMGSVFKTAASMMNGVSVWMVASFVIAGLLHEVLDAGRVRRSSVCSTKISGVLNSTIIGALIPICSCGSVPLGIGLYHSGAYLGPTLAFITAVPILNPIAIILTYGLLGKEIATVYLITGVIASMLIGIVANRFGGSELHRPQIDSPGERIQIEVEKPTILGRLKSGMRWSFGELIMMVSKYTVTGMLLMGLFLTVIPQSGIQRYLGSPGLISLLGATVIAALMYVCAIGHIPFIAAVVASGAAPGVAITFLMAGAATNITELLTINRTIGKRSMLMYLIMVLAISNIAGYLTNRMFPGFTPAISYNAATHSVSAANHLLIAAPEWLRYICSLILAGYAAWSLVKYIMARKAAIFGRADKPSL